MHILVVTDAWFPQINGVVHTLRTVSSHLGSAGHRVEFITPLQFFTLPCPSYPDIRLAFPKLSIIESSILGVRPDAIHIATEGPIGIAVRHFCVQRNVPFSSSFLSRFPEYIHARTRLPSSWTYALLRWFHNPSSAVMVASKSIQTVLEQKGFRKLCRWSRGVDLDLFRLRDKTFLPYTRPILLYVGRVAVEKNIEAFLKVHPPGTKVVVGHGPQLLGLMSRYPDVHFVGAKFGEELAQYYSSADVFVFPSRTDVFGNVQLEALASGVPIAAFPVPGPLARIMRQGWRV